MLGCLRRRRILRERQEAAPARLAAVRDFVAALRAADEALDAMRNANDRFYRSDRDAEQAILSSLRRDRERVFQFTALGEIVAEAPHLARLLSLKIFGGRSLPLVAWVTDTNERDLAAITDA